MMRSHAQAGTRLVCPREEFITKIALTSTGTLAMCAGVVTLTATMAWPGKTTPTNL